MQFGKEEVKLSLFKDDTYLYIESPKGFTKKKNLELINELRNVTRYKIKIQKFVAILYVNKKLSEREIKKTIQLELH